MSLLMLLLLSGNVVLERVCVVTPRLFQNADLVCQPVLFWNPEAPYAP